jgi:uncharacterized protein (TIGR00730 family)
MNKRNLKRICVNCGSSPGINPEYAQAARELGKTLVDNKIELVFGGADVGLMGELADAVLQMGGTAIGIIPESFADKVSHKSLTELNIVKSMHQRKQMMFDLSDGFIALPGGMGTLDEVFEILTWAQLGLHKKPIGILNICGYYDNLLSFLDHSVAQMFLRPEHRNLLIAGDSPERLLTDMAGYQAPDVEKWLGLKKEEMMQRTAFKKDRTNHELKE